MSDVDQRAKALEAIKTLVENFRRNEAEYTSPGSAYNETQLRRDFVDPFFKILGWDVANESGVSQNLREVVHEANVGVEEATKKPDYAFRVAGLRKFFLEAKKPSVKIESDSKSAFQLRRYGWSAKMPVSVISNFKYLVIYDCKAVPKETDDFRVGKLKQYSYEEFVTRFDEIYDSLSRDALFSGKFDTLFERAEARAVMQVDSYFLAQIEKWRLMLAEEIVKKNPSVSQSELNYLVQTFLNRLVFLRICEDRDLEKYETLLKVNTKSVYAELLQLFRQADTKYNSGLFDFTKDVLSSTISVGNETLLSIIRELYYPQSPYIFSAIEANLLGEIYEMFLLRQIVKTGKRSVKVKDKFEGVKEKGVVTTPRFVINEIIARSVKKFIEGKDPSEVSKLRLADICCGSGAFLLAVYQYLIDYHTDWYVKDGWQKHRDKIYQGPGNSWFLTLEEKRRILLDNIFGVDIDDNAVEVAKFSLLVKLLEGENDASVASLYSKYKIRALPDLDHNLHDGNALVDDRFFKFRSASSLKSSQRDSIRIFEWKKQFPDVMKEGGFDVIVGNPPYTRIQMMKKMNALELEYFQSKFGGYECGQTSNFDKYFLFIERAMRLLKPNGILGYIVPHKFMKIKVGESLRRLISRESYLNEVVHFGKEQVFGTKTTTYTCILVLANRINPTFDVELVSDIDSWKLGTKGLTATLDKGEISSNPWIFIIGPLKALYDRLNAIPTKLRDVAKIYVGLQTSADDIYIVRPLRGGKKQVTFIDYKGKKRTIEKGILRPCIYDLVLQPYSTPNRNAFIIFPYKLQDGKAVPYSLSEMKKYWPRTLSYLQAYRRILKKRSIQGGKGSNGWYRFGRSQSLAKFDGREKLIVKVLSLEPCFTFDSRNLLFTGGGNGPYYGVSAKNEADISIHYLQGLLNNLLMNVFIANSTSIFQNGYLSYGKQFIEGLPILIPKMTEDGQRKLHDGVVDLVQKIIELSKKLDKEMVPATRSRLESQMNALKDELDGVIDRIYGVTEEERKYIATLGADE